MSDDHTTADPDPTAAAAPDGETPAQAEPDWKAEARKWESRAKENKQKADQFDHLQEANKTEAQKQADALAQAQQQASESQQALLRYEVGAAKGVPANLIGRLQGSTREELETDADALLAAFPASSGTPTATKPVATLASGATSVDQQQPVDSNEALRRLFLSR